MPVGKPPRPRSDAGRRAARGVAALLTPTALVFFLLGGWIFAAERRLTDAFPIQEGFLSYWEFWIAAAASLLLAARALDLYAGASHD
jgi:hypothetical protein